MLISEGCSGIRDDLGPTPPHQITCNLKTPPCPSPSRCFSFLLRFHPIQIPTQVPQQHQPSSHQPKHPRSRNRRSSPRSLNAAGPSLPPPSLPSPLASKSLSPSHHLVPNQLSRLCPSIMNPFVSHTGQHLRKSPRVNRIVLVCIHRGAYVHALPHPNPVRIKLKQSILHNPSPPSRQSSSARL